MAVMYCWFELCGIILRACTEAKVAWTVAEFFWGVFIDELRIVMSRHIAYMEHFLGRFSSPSHPPNTDRLLKSSYVR